MNDFELYFIILEKVELLEKLLSGLNDSGICNATIFPSSSMSSSMSKHEDSHIIAAFRAFMASDRAESRTILFMDSKNKYNTVRDILKAVLGDINKPNTAMLFTVPVSNADGVYNTCDV